MERLSARERDRIAELLSEGAPFWRLCEEVNRSRVGDCSCGEVVAATGAAGTQAVAAALREHFTPEQIVEIGLLCVMCLVGRFSLLAGLGEPSCPM